MRSALIVGIALLAAVASATAALAAQNGIVVVETASIFREPYEGSDTLANVTKGTVLRMSSKKKKEWYQVEVPGGAEGSRYGWIQSAAVDRESLIEDLKEAGIATGQVVSRDSGRHFIILRGFYGFHWFIANELRTGGAFLRKPELGGELGYRLWTTWTVLAHFSQLKAVTTVGSASSDFRGTFLALVFEHSLWHRLPWKIDIAIGGGALTNARLTVSAGKTVTATAPTTLYGGLGRIALRWHLFERLALGIEGGTRYILPKSVPLGGATTEFKLTSAFLNGSLQLEIF